MKEGFDLVAMGHYARLKNRVRKRGKLRRCLYTAKDKLKDQTYFLALVDEAAWERVLFPLGDYYKSEVRQMAREWKMEVAEKKDSTGVCFVGEVKMQDFLAKELPVKMGKVMRVVDGKKVIVGEHRGVGFYTLGQRHGLKIYQNETQMPVLYVLKKNRKRNELVVGEKWEGESEGLVVKKLVGEGLSSDNGKSSFCVRIRHQGELVGVRKMEKMAREKWRLELEKKVFAISPGQFAVFYEQDSEDEDNYFCVGVGEIGD
jgi:tRNA-specific 2-thiouridylase